MTQSTSKVITTDDALRQPVLVIQNIALNAFLFVALGVYLVVQTGAWQAYQFIVLSTQIVVMGVISIALIRRERLTLGKWIFFASDLIAPVWASLLVSKLGYVAVVYILITAYFMIRYAMPKESRNATLAFTAIGLLISFLAEWTDPAWRLVSPLMLTVAPILTALLGVVFIVMIVRQTYGGIAPLLQASIRNRLTAIVIGAALVPILLLAIIVGTIGYIQIRNSLTQQAFNKLTSVQTIKSNQIQSYLAERKSDMQTLADVVHTEKDRATEKLEITNALKSGELTRLFQTWDADVRDVASDPGVAAGMSAGDYEQQGFFAGYIAIHGYEDAFLIDPAGMVVYSVHKGAVVGANLTSDSYKDSNLAGLYLNLKGAKTGKTYLADAALLDGKMSMFIGAPIYEGSTFVGILAYQLPLAQINTIVQNRIGLSGESGETYLVGKIGGENQLRSDRTVKEGKIGDPKPGTDVDSALSGESGNDFKIGSTGDSEVSVYQPLEIPGLNWAILSTISTLDVFAPQIEGKKDYFTTYAENYGYYDILLVDHTGYVFYSIAHESDYQSNLLTGEYSNSNLGSMLAEFSAGNPQDLQFEFVDFAHYAPSGGKPAAFLAIPVLDNNNELEISLVAQVSLDKINEIMNEHTGLGETGETYLVGTDQLFRNDSRFLSDLGVTTTVLNETHKVDTIASRAALAGETGQQAISDYRGVLVLSAWSSFVIVEPDNAHPAGERWAVIAEIDSAEALAPVTQLAGVLGIVIGLSVLGIGALAVFLGARFALGIARPIISLSETASQIAGGNFNLRTEVAGTDEIGALGESFNNMTARLGAAFEDVHKRAAELATVAEVGTVTATILETNKLLQEVVNLTKERFNLYHSHIYLLDEAGENLVLAMGAGEAGQQMKAKGLSIPLNREQSLVARAARERKGITVNDVTQAPDFLPNLLLPDTRSELAVPMIVGGKVIGVFDVQSELVGRFTDSDINIQTTLASQVATSIQNVRSFEQSKTQADLESLVNAIGQKIQRATTIEDTLQTAIREVGLALGASRVSANLQVSQQDNGNVKNN